MIWIDCIKYFVANPDQADLPRYYYNKNKQTFTQLNEPQYDCVLVPQIDLGDLYRDYVNIRGIAYQLPESFPDGKDYLVLPGKICYHSPENLAKASDVISCVERWAQKRFGNQNDNDLHRYIVFRLLSIIRKWALENNIKDIKLVQPYLPENKLKFINIMALINIKSHKNDQTK
jgi:hypothetical protein